MSHKKDEYEKLKLQILKIGIVIPGTIRKTYLICGKENCKCSQSEDDRHGPYHFWNRKVGGRLTSKSIAPSQLHHYEQWISNRRDLERLVEELLNFGLSYASSSQNNTAQQETGKPRRAK